MWRPGQRVEVGELARLPELAGVLDRRRRPLGQLLELADVLVPEAARAVARVDGEIADPAAALLERDGEAGVDRARRAVLVRAVAVGDLDRPGRRAVRRPGDRLGPVRGEAVRRHGRRPVGPFEPDERGVDALEPRARLERPREHLVHVDRAGDLPEEPRAPPFLLGALDRPGELLRELVHAFFQRLDDGADPLVGLPPRPPRDKRHQHHEGENAARRGPHR